MDELYGSVWNVARGARTDPDAWVDAAYARFRAEGLAGVRIEALARDLGTTKGSFYWHFADRRALVDAVMARWEEQETDRYIAESSVELDPRRRIELLFSVVGQRRPPGEDRLYMAAVAEGVGDVVERVTRRRIRYVADALIEHGVAPAEAESRALISIASILGLEQLAQGGAASVFPARPALSASLIDYMFS
jgi:AcrR family transcriptional regulator